MQSRFIKGIFLFLIIILCSNVFSYSAYSVRKPDEKKIIKLKKDPDLIYTRKPVHIPYLNDIKEWFLEFLEKYIEKPLGKINFSYLKYFAIGTAALMIIFIIIKVFQTGFFEGKRNVSSEIDLFDTIDDVYSPEIENLIDKYLTEKNYSIVIRLYFNKILRELSDNNIIAWEKNKTNRDYSCEIFDNNLKSNFNEFSNIFEHVWYGNFEVDATAFKNIQKLYNTIIGNQKEGIR